MYAKIDLILLTKKYYWIANIIFFSFITLVIKDSIKKLLAPNVEGFDILFGLFMIYICIGTITRWIKYFINTPSRIIVENEIMLVEKLYLKPITIPLKDISSIVNTGFGSRTFKEVITESHIINYEEKMVYINCIIFEFARVDLNKFILELKFRVDAVNKNA